MAYKDIYYCDVKYSIRTYRGNTPKVKTYFVKKIVCSDPDSRSFKIRLLTRHFSEKSNTSKLVNKFDLNNVYVRRLCVFHVLNKGYNENSRK